MSKAKLVILLSGLLFLVSCKTTEYIPVEVVQKEYIHIHTIDTVIHNNTTYIKDKGDTVYIYNKEYKYVYKDRVDTCIIHDTTTIAITKYVDRVEYVEVNKIKDWQIILMVLGGLLLGIIGYKLLRIIKK